MKYLQEVLTMVRTVFQTIGGAFSTSAGQAVFMNRLLATLPKTVPGVSSTLILQTGASDLHNAVPAEMLPGVIQAYMVGIKAAFAVGLAFCAMAFLSSLAIPTRKLPSHVLEKDSQTSV